MENARVYRPARREETAKTRGKLGARLALCLAMTALALAGRVWYPQGVTRAAAVIFGAQDTPVRQVFSDFTQTMAKHGAAEAFASLYGSLSERAADRD